MKIKIMWIEDEAILGTPMDQSPELFNLFTFSPSDVNYEAEEELPSGVKALYITDFMAYHRYLDSEPCASQLPDVILSDFHLNNDESDKANVNGIIIAALHSMKYSGLPCGIVSASNKYSGSEKENYNSIMRSNLHTINGISKVLSEHCGAEVELGYSESQKDLSSLCKRGVQALRKNIQILVKKGEVLIPLENIYLIYHLIIDADRFNGFQAINISEIGLEVNTKFGTRIYSIEALFFDIKHNQKCFIEELRLFLLAIKDESEVRAYKYAIEMEEIRNRVVHDSYVLARTKISCFISEIENEIESFIHGFSIYAQTKNKEILTNLLKQYRRPEEDIENVKHNFENIYIKLLGDSKNIYQNIEYIKSLFNSDRFEFYNGHTNTDESMSFSSAIESLKEFSWNRSSSPKGQFSDSEDTIFHDILSNRNINNKDCRISCLFLFGCYLADTSGVGKTPEDETKKLMSYLCSIPRKPTVIPLKVDPGKFRRFQEMDLTPSQMIKMNKDKIRKGEEHLIADGFLYRLRKLNLSHSEWSIITKNIKDNENKFGKSLANIISKAQQ